MAVCRPTWSGVEQPQKPLMQEPKKWTARLDARVLSIGLFLVLALPTVFSWRVTAAQDRTLLRTQTEITAAEVAERLSDHLTLRYAMMHSLSHEMTSGALWSQHRFQQRAEQIQKDFPGFQAINWVDTEGVIRWVTPEADNRRARGKRVAEHPVASNTFAATQRSWTPGITPPLQLFQGGVGFASYFPLGSKQTPRGYINAVFRVEPLVTQVLSPRVQQYFHVALVASDHPLFVHGETPRRASSFFVESPLRFEGQRWTLQIAPSAEFTKLTLGSSRRTLMGALGLTAALLASFLAFRFLSENEARARLASLVEASDDLIALFDPNGRLQYINGAGRRLLGAAPSALDEQALKASPAKGLLGMHWTEVFELRRDPDLTGAAPKKPPPSLLDVQGSEWQICPLDGASGIDSEVVTFPVQSQRRERLLGVIARDARERNRLEWQLLQSQKMEAVGTLAGGVAHDFNNLLTAIIGNAELAKLDVDPESEAELSLDNILDASELAASLTARLLAFSRRSSPTAEPFGLDDAILGSARLLRRLVREDVALDVVTAAPSASLCGDPAELQQVLMNLVVNARDAIESNGRIQICTSMDYDSSGAAIALLEVIDNGSGMTSEVAGSVFEPFFTTKPTGKGTGLGLAMVKSAVDRLGGKITVESRLEVGTRIAITLPAGDMPLSARTMPKLGLVAPTVRRKFRILLAEDSPAIRRVLELGLGRAGYLLTPKENGATALRELEGGESFDALLTDVVMPGLDGVHLARAFRERFPGAPVIFISGYEDEGAALDAIQHGTHLLPKPFRLTELLKLLDEQLHHRSWSISAKS